MADAPAPRGHGALVVGISVVVSVVLVVVVAIALLARSNHGDDAHELPPGAASRALARLDANDGEAYAGTIGDVTDPARLRRALRSEFRSHEARTGRGGSPARARRCATELRAASDEGRGRVVLLADATLAGAPAAVIGITDHGRVVAFVADAETCAVRTAQSL